MLDGNSRTHEYFFWFHFLPSSETFLVTLRIWGRTWTNCMQISDPIIWNSACNCALAIFDNFYDHFDLRASQWLKTRLDHNKSNRGIVVSRENKPTHKVRVQLCDGNQSSSINYNKIMAELNKLRVCDSDKLLMNLYLICKSYFLERWRHLWDVRARAHIKISVRCKLCTICVIHYSFPFMVTLQSGVCCIYPSSTLFMTREWIKCHVCRTQIFLSFPF